MTHNSKNSLLLTTPTRPTLRRYSLSDMGYTSPSNRNRSKYSPMQELYSPELAYKCTHIDSRSPGYATRVVQYNEEQEKSLPISQPRYNRPGIFPVVHFFKKGLPLKPIQSTPRMNHSADLSKYNSPEHNRMLLETIIQSNSPSKVASPHSNEVNTKSVLDALKEISRKRIHSNEEDFLMNESAKRACMNSYVTGSNLTKRAKLNSLQPEGSISSKSHLGNYCSMDELKASFSSMDERPVKKQKTKIIDVVPESANTSFKSPSPVQSSIDVETQTSLDVPETKEPVIVTKQVPHEEKVKLEDSSHQSKVKKVLPVKIFDETPLETMRKNRLVALMGSLTEDKVTEKQKIEPKINADTKSEKPSPEKPLVSILAGPTKSPNKTAKHVTFNIPESTNSTSAETSNTAYSAVSNDLKPRPEANIITKTSAALVTPIVSSHVAEMSPMKQPEMKSDSQLITSTSNITWSPKQDSNMVNFKPVMSNPSQSSPSSGQIPATNVTTQPSFSFGPNNFMMKPPASSSNEQLPNSNQMNQSKSEKPVFFLKPLETSPGSSPKGGFKFNLSSNTAVTSVPFKIPPSVSTVLSNASQQNNTRVSTANMPILGHVTSSSSANTLLPPQTTTAAIGTASSTTNFQISTNGFNTGAASNFGIPVGSGFPSGKNKPPTNVISPSFATTVAANKPLPPNIFNVQGPPASVTSPNFVTSSNSTSKPTFAFSASVKPATPGMFDSIGKSAAPITTASGHPSITQLNTNSSTALAFNKPTISFGPPSVPFGTMFSGNGSSTTNSTNNNPPFGTIAFNANNPIFSASNLPPLSNYKTDNTNKPIFGQNNAPQFGPATGSVFSNNPQTTNAFAATTNTFTPTTNAFAAPTNTFTPTTNSFATTTNAFSTAKHLFTTTNAFAPTTNAFATTTNAFPATTNAFPATTNAFAATTNAFATTTATTSNIFGNTSFGIPATTAATFNSNPPPNFGANTFGMNQNPGFSGTASNATPVFGTLFGAVTTTPTVNPAGNFPTNSTVFSPNFGNNSTAKPNNFEVGQFQGANNTFGGGNFPVNLATTQSEVFTFGVNSSKPGVFSFGNSEPSKASFNFSGENTANSFGANNKGFGAFTAAQPTPPPQFNMQGGPPGMFNIGMGPSTPNRSRTQLKAKRRT